MKIYLSILLLLAAAMGANAQAVQKASLANNADNSSQTIYLYANAIQQSLSQGYIYIDAEVFKVLNATLSPSVVTGNSIVITTIQRAILGTAATVHLAGTTVFYGYPSQFVSTDPQGPCVPYGTQYLNYADSKIFSCGPTGAWFGVTTVIGVTSVNGQGGNVVIPVPQQAATNPANPCNATDPIVQLTTGQGGAYTCNPTSHTWQLVPPLTQNVTTTGNITGVGLFGSVLTIGGTGTTTPSTFNFTQPSVPAHTDLLRVSVNNCPTSIEWGGSSTPVLMGITGCTKANDNEDFEGLAAGGAFYSLAGKNNPHTASVGVFAGCNVSDALSGGCWGANFAGTNTDITGKGYHTSAWGLEVDCNVGANGGSVAANCWGVAAVSSAADQPDGAYDAFDARITPGSAFAWKNAFTSEPGAAEVGVELWPVSQFGSNSPSQPIQLVSKDAGGNFRLSNIYLDATGSIQISVGNTSGNVNLNPLVTPNAVSPELVFTSYDGSGTAQVGGIFLDNFGNLNFNPSNLSFSQTLLSNGSGETEAIINKHSFQMTKHTSDPGCSVVSQVGSWWVDNSVPTVLSYCKQTGASTFAWSVVTTTP